MDEAEAENAKDDVSLAMLPRTGWGEEGKRRMEMLYLNTNLIV